MCRVCVHIQSLCVGVMCSVGTATKMCGRVWDRTDRATTNLGPSWSWLLRLQSADLHAAAVLLHSVASPSSSCTRLVSLINDSKNYNQAIRVEARAAYL